MISIKMCFGLHLKRDKQYLKARNAKCKESFGLHLKRGKRYHKAPKSVTQISFGLHLKRGKPKIKQIEPNWDGHTTEEKWARVDTIMGVYDQ